MKGTIFTRIVKNRSYVIYKRSYREKINPENSGKTRNTGKSKVKTQNIHLGTLESVLNTLTGNSPSKEFELEKFGFEAAMYDIIKKLKIREMLDECFPGSVSGIKVCDYLIIAIIFRAFCTKPKTHINNYMKKNILTRILKIDYKKLTSANFWLAYDKIVSEKSLSEKREEIKKLKEIPTTKEIKKKIAELEKEYSSIQNIDNFQIKFWEVLIKEENINSDTLYIDATNFYNYIKNLYDESILCARGKNKDGKNNLNQITLLSSVTTDFGLPILSEIYKGSYNDVSIFPNYLTKLINAYCELKTKAESINICYDKGNNSQDNYDTILNLSEEKDIKIYIIGSLSNKHYKKYMRYPLKKFENTHTNFKYYSFEDNVFSTKQKIVITFNEKRKKREKITFNNKLKKHIQKINDYYSNLTDKYKKRVTAAIIQNTINNQILKYPPFKKLITIELNNNNSNEIPDLIIKVDASKKYKLYRTFGKSIVFSNNLKLSPTEIIDIYYSKNKIDQFHKMLKCPEAVSFSPNWLWTDSKLKVQSFVNIMALTILKLAEKRFNESKNVFSANAATLKSLLKEIKKIIIIKNYDKKDFEIAVNKLNDLSKAIYDTFNLDDYLMI